MLGYVRRTNLGGRDLFCLQRRLEEGGYRGEGDVVGTVSGKVKGRDTKTDEIHSIFTLVPHKQKDTHLLK